ncbi:MAG: GldG family protein [Clostridiales bacterium]|nr:GldG family protein [Clostridiales bacterium]
MSEEKKSINETTAPDSQPAAEEITVESENSVAEASADIKAEEKSDGASALDEAVFDEDDDDTSDVVENIINDKKAKKKKDKKDKKGKKAKKSKKSKENGGLKEFLKSRKARHGSVAVAIVAVVVAIVIVINVIFSLLSDRFPNMYIDLTSNNSFALQDDTIDYMSHLDDDVTVYILMSESDYGDQGTYFVQSQQLLNKMKSSSDGKLTLKYVDLTSNPSFTSSYTNVDWTSSSENYLMLVECGDQYKVLTLDDCFEYDATTYAYYGEYSFTGTTVEQAVVTAVLNVTTEDKVVVDILTGNKEQDYSAISSLLEDNAYEVNEVSLATGELDEDAEIVILYAPSVDLDEDAAETISEWLDNDGDYGRTFIYIPTADMPDTPNLDVLLDDWGMQVDTGYVFETSTDRLVSSSSAYSFIVDYTDYYTDNLKNSSIPVVVIDSHDIIITDDSVAHGLLTTSTGAGVLPIDADEDWDYQEAISGEELNIAAEGIKTNTDEETSNVIVFGSYSMFNSSVMSYNSFNNSAYLMNVINTLSDKDDNSITIESKSLDSGELGITDVSTQNVMFAVFVVIIPIGILVAGMVIWLRRRNR